MNTLTITLYNYRHAYNVHVYAFLHHIIMIIINEMQLLHSLPCVDVLDESTQHEVEFLAVDILRVPHIKYLHVQLYI